MLNVILKPFVRYLPENNRLERIWKLAQVDFKKRYYNDSLGLFWALLNPLLQITVYYFVFKYLLNRGGDNFALFLYAGLIIWLTFAQSSMKGLSIIASKRYLLENIQFNKLDLFYSQVLSVFMGFAFNLGAYVFLCYLLGVRFSWEFIFFPIILFNLALMCLGMAMILATIKIFLKDIVHAWSIIMLFGFWTSGIFFSSKKVAEWWEPLLYLQPFLGMISNLRAMSNISEDPEYKEVLNWSLMGIDMLWGILFFSIGVFVFNKYSAKALELA